MKYYLIAGEASGDMHGANLMKSIKAKDDSAEFRFWGGDKMKLVGGEQVEHYRNTAFMGFWEVLTHLRTILGFLKRCKADITAFQPDVLILIDYPGFNLRVAKFAKLAGFKVVYYISPQVWAWKENRVKAIKKYVDKMLVILPFEQDFYKKWDYQVDFVGHPLLDELKPEMRHSKSENTKIALLPGSRKQEISKILPVFLSLYDAFPNYEFVIAGLNHIDASFYKNLIGNRKLEVVYDQTYNLLAESYAAVVASGTATLETALFNVPMVVGYKGSWLSYQIGKLLVNLEYISLVNLIMNKPVVKELIQVDLTKEKLKVAFNELLDAEHRSNMQKDFVELTQRLGNSGASERAAQIISDFTKS